MQADLTGFSAVVTGGSSGIGLATARLFLQSGARVAICGRDTDRLDRAEAALAPHADGRLMAAACDVLDPVQVGRFADTVSEAFGGLDILVCNAGQGRMSSFTETADDDWQEELNLKFFSVIHPVRAFREALGASGRAAIVCVNSLLAKQPEPHMVATSAARAGLLNMVHSLAHELAPDEIRVNSILLGLVDSGQWRRRHAAQAADGESFEDWSAALARSKGIPMGRLGRPEEPANAIFFLSSGQASYITGQVLAADGGFEATGVGLPALRK